jgi:hypothetical protein
MPKRISKRSSDINQAAFEMVERSTAEQPIRTRTTSKAEISRVMSAMGRKGGKIGGKRRLVTMTPEERQARALQAAKARWGGNKELVKVSAAKSKREAGLRKLSVIFEEQLTALGFNEEQKNARVAEFSAFVDAKVASAKSAKQLKPLQNAALRARG